MADLKKMYKTIMDDDFPEQISVGFGDMTLCTVSEPGRLPMKKRAN